MNVIRRIAGTTFAPTWTSSGAVASPISSALFDRNEQLVNSVTAQSSGNGMYWALHLLPNSPAWYANEWRAVVSANTYVDRQLVQAYHPEVD